MASNHRGPVQDFQLKVEPQKLDSKFPFFRRPIIVGEFSLDANRQFHSDRSRVQFYHPPSSSKEVHLDLNVGLDKVVTKNQDECKEERLNHMMRWISLNMSKFQISSSDESLKELNTDFVCFRGCLSMIMCTPYERREAWKITAVKWKNTIYLHKEETPQQTLDRQNTTERQRTMGCWGYKFEHYLMSGHPTEPNENAGLPSSEPVLEPEEFCCVYRTRLGQFSIVYGAEMDGIRVSENVKKCEENLSALDLNRETFVELKTSRFIENERQNNNFRKFKCLKWWSQSFLVGIPLVICGFRDDEGIVFSIEEFKVSELPEKGRPFWQPNVCMNFLQEFFTFTKKVLNGKPELNIVDFEFEPRSGTIFCKMNSSVDQDTLLPQWFKSKLKL